MDSQEAEAPATRSAWWAFFRNVRFGMLVTIVLGCVFPNEVGVFILASIVCTGGLGLAIWIPVWWAIGAVISSLFYARGP